VSFFYFEGAVRQGCILDGSSFISDQGCEKEVVAQQPKNKNNNRRRRKSKVLRVTIKGFCRRSLLSSTSFLLRTTDINKT